MRLGIFAKTFEGATPEVVLAAATRAGFTTVQYNMACSGLAALPESISLDRVREIAEASSSLSVSVAAVSGTYNMIHPDLAVRSKGLERLEVLASRCHAMSTRMITLCTGTRDPLDQWHHHPDNTSAEAWQDLLASMESAIAIAERWDIKLGIEPELANVVSSAKEARALIDDLKSPRIRIVLDAANLFERTTLGEQRLTVASAIDLLADRISMAHAKDRAADGGFVAAGKGVLDYRHYLRSLAAAGFDGPLITHGLEASEAAGAARFLRQTATDAGVEMI
jgi:sugar phosphate isomerase/epimerase